MYAADPNNLRTIGFFNGEPDGGGIFHANVGTCGNLWLTSDARHIITGCGEVVSAPGDVTDEPMSMATLIPISRGIVHPRAPRSRPGPDLRRRTTKAGRG